MKMTEEDKEIIYQLIDESEQNARNEERKQPVGVPCSYLSCVTVEAFKERAACLKRLVE